MKRLLIAVACMAISGIASAQCPGCVIDMSCTGSVPTLCPPALPDATQGQPYDEDLTFYLPQTFTDAGSGTQVTLQQIVVTGLSGVPAGLSWQTNSPNNTYTVTSDPNTQRGCAKVCGTPSLPGSYNVTVSVIATVNTIIGVQSVPQSFTLPLTVLPAAGGNPYFSFSPSSGCGNTDVTFQALLNLGLPQITEYEWTFDNGNTSTDQNPPAQTYTGAGEYHPTLTTNIFNHVFNSLSVTSLPGNWWNSEFIVDEGSGGAADLVFSLSHGSGTFNAPEIANNNTPTWNNLGVILDGLTISITFVENDAISANDNGGTYAFVVPGPGTYNFSTTTTDVGYTGGVVGNFTIIKQLFDSYVATDTVRIYDLPPLPVIASSSGSFDMCSTSPITLSVYGGYNYEWYMNDTTLLVGALDSAYTVSDPQNYPTVATYKVKITDPATGCAVWSPSVTVTVNEGIPTGFSTGGALYINGVLKTNYTYPTYQWLLDGTPLVPSGQSQTLVPAVNGNYSLVVTNAFGCSDTSNVIAVFNVGIDEASALQQYISVYPNPSNGEFTLNMDVELTGSLNISLVDLSGKTVYAEQVSQLNGAFSKTFNLQHLSSGIYTLNLAFEQGTVRRKIIIR